MRTKVRIPVLRGSLCECEILIHVIILSQSKYKPHYEVVRYTDWVMGHHAKPKLVKMSIC